MEKRQREKIPAAPPNLEKTRSDAVQKIWDYISKKMGDEYSVRRSEISDQIVFYDELTEDIGKYTTFFLPEKGREYVLISMDYRKFGCSLEIQAGALIFEDLGKEIIWKEVKSFLDKGIFPKSLRKIAVAFKKEKISKSVPGKDRKSVIEISTSEYYRSYQNGLSALLLKF